jgi:predicted GNAT family acetyltransferase
MTFDDVQLTRNADESRYEITVDGTLAGYMEYSLHGDRADFLHTEVAEEFGGRGLASQLIRYALDDARRQNWQVVPYCPFVKAFIAKHDDYRELVPAGERARFDLAE